MTRPHQYPFIPYRSARFSPAEMIDRGREFRDFLQTRRSVRLFSAEPVPRECIDLAIECANTGPSGAHRQPWKFAVIGDPGTRHRIRAAAEVEERENYRMGLATLTHTPNPMGFLNDVCNRPSTERPYILFPVGYAAPDAEVPDLARKTLDEVLVSMPVA